MATFEQPKKHILLVTPEFDLDISNIDALLNMKEKVLKYISDEQVTIIIFNLKFCKFIDSSGLGQLLRIYDEIHKKNGKIFVCNIDSNVKNFFDITNLGDYFIPQANCNDIENLIKKL